MKTQNTTEISWSDFSKIDIRVGTIINAEPFEQAHNPSYILYIDFGKLGIKKSSAQITQLYTPEKLLGKQIIAVVNFPEKQIANIKSQCLILGVVNDQEVTLLTTDQPVTNGLKIA